MFANLSSEAREWKAKLEAINKSQAVIEFNLDGTIVTANDNAAAIAFAGGAGALAPASACQTLCNC